VKGTVHKELLEKASPKCRRHSRHL
jgi:hypothetical protein